MKTWLSGDDLVRDLATYSLPNVFNPYRDHCAQHDLEEGPAIRSANLTSVVNAALHRGADELWIGLELGARGGRRTGLPLTDEFTLESCASYWGLPSLSRATIGAPVREETAKYIWQAIAQSQRRVFFWNAFPFHCHNADSITNRGHTRSEVEQIPAIVPWLATSLAVKKIVSLGRDAESALIRMGITSQYVRHPGRSGGRAFLEGIRKT